MSTQDTQITDLANRIKPSIDAALAAHEFDNTFQCPLTGIVYDVIKRCDADVDEDNPELFTLQIQFEDGTNHSKLDSIEAAVQAIAEHVAANMINAKVKLQHASAELGLS